MVGVLLPPPSCAAAESPGCSRAGAGRPPPPPVLVLLVLLWLGRPPRGSWWWRADVLGRPRRGRGAAAAAARRRRGTGTGMARGGPFVATTGMGPGGRRGGGRRRGSARGRRASCSAGQRPPEAFAFVCCVWIDGVRSRRLSARVGTHSPAHTPPRQQQRIQSIRRTHRLQKVHGRGDVREDVGGLRHLQPPRVAEPLHQLQRRAEPRGVALLDYEDQGGQDLVGPG